jgi:hypothetical protein
MWMLSLLLACLVYSTVYAEDLGNLSANPFGAGNPFGNQSAINPYATDAPQLYDQQGHDRGNLSANPYNLDSTSNPFGRYGDPYSPNSLNNPYGVSHPYAADSPYNPYTAGNPYAPDSPNYSYGSGWRLEEGH